VRGAHADGWLADCHMRGRGRPVALPAMHDACGCVRCEGRGGPTHNCAMSAVPDESGGASCLG
jgi:hypothetical protein